MNPTPPPNQPQFPPPPSNEPETPRGVSETNIAAVAGLILSFVFSPVGLIVSIIGLQKAKEYNGNGKGLAIAGIVISVVPILLLGILYSLRIAGLDSPLQR